MERSCRSLSAAVGVNGDRAYILDMASTDPKHWTEDKPPLPSPLDAVIYELHVRDYTIHPDSGVKHRGKFKGLAETGTRGPGGIRTGLDHIVELGATHVELLPIYDFATEAWMKPGFMSRSTIGDTTRRTTMLPRALILRIVCAGSSDS